MIRFILKPRDNEKLTNFFTIDADIPELEEALSNGLINYELIGIEELNKHSESGL